MGELPRFHSEDWPKARKEHKCCECYRTIKPGERYQLFKGCWDGEWETFKTCSDCDELKNQIIGDLYVGSDEGIPFGYLAEWAKEYGYEFTYHNTKEATDANS